MFQGTQSMPFDWESLQVWGGSSTGRAERLATQAMPPRSKASTPSGGQPGHPAGGAEGGLGAADPQRAAVEPEHRARSPVWAATMSSRHSFGCGSQGWAAASGGEKPNGGSVPVQGSGTRLPSRPGSAPPVRCQIGSWRTGTGRSASRP